MGKKGRRLFEAEVEVEDWKSRRLLKERIIKRELGKLTATRSSTEREIGKESRAGRAGASQYVSEAVVEWLLWPGKIVSTSLS